MIDGATEITDLDKTETNRAFVRTCAEEVLIKRRVEKLHDFIDDGLIQHDPEIADGIPALRSALENSFETGPALRYDSIHCVLAEGNFVLCMCEGAKNGVRAGLYDLYRVEGGKIVEHWNTIEAIPSRDRWKNENGKF